VGTDHSNLERAREAAEAHVEFIDGTRPGSDRDRVERALLDPTMDPEDVRYGDPHLYGGDTFADWMRGHAQRAMTFTATTDLMREILLTQEMMTEEGIEWLPLLPHHLPTPTGFMLFPHGVECPVLVKPADPVPAGAVTWDRWMIDGLLWTTNDNVARDGVADDPTDGVVVFPLTRNRAVPGDRPFHPSRPLPVGMLVASDLTAWAFDEPGMATWDSMADVHARWQDRGLLLGNAEGNDVDRMVADLEALRWWMRSLVWSCWRWMTEEVWVPGELDRAARRRLNRARPVFHENQPQDGDIVIVDLRPERREAIERGEAAGEPPWWRCRWLVRGHWAKRRTAVRGDDGTPVGPVRGPNAVEGVTYVYRHVWIEPYEKGPDNAPLVVKDKIGVVLR
jgi:hypothetical protein